MASAASAGGPLRWLALCAALVLAAAPPPVRAETVDAAGIYKKRCQKCHGADGRGEGKALARLGVNARDWTDRAAMAEVSDDYLFDIVCRGGEALGRSSKMKGQCERLSEAEIRALVGIVRAFASRPASASN